MAVPAILVILSLVSVGWTDVVPYNKPRVWGTNIHLTSPRPGEAQMLAEGFQIARMDFGWERIEKAKGKYNWDSYDTLLHSFESTTPPVRSYWILDYGNPLYDGGLPPTSDEAIKAFADFAVASVEHFKGHGIVWEMWNEPNGGFWKPRANITQYCALAVAVGEALEAANLLTSETYIGPATAGIDMDFIEGAFACGMLKYWSAISVHPYRATGPETVLGDYDNIRKLMSNYTNTPRPIFSGEWGWSSCLPPCTPGSFTGIISEKTQAEYLTRQWLTNALADVPVSIYYDWHNDGPNMTMREENFGTTRYEYYNETQPYLPKPAYTAASVLQANLAGRTVTAYKNIPNNTTYVVTFDKGEAYAVWTSTANITTEVAFSANGCFTNTGMLGEKQEDICASAGGEVKIAATSSPSYLVQKKR